MFNNLPRYSFTPKVKNVNYFDESFGLACITMRQRILKHILTEASKHSSEIDTTQLFNFISDINRSTLMTSLEIKVFP